MGIRGLTTFIDKHSDKYFERHQLHNTHIVIDGNNLAMQMYKWHCKCYDCFGGDYDKYAKKVNFFFHILKECNVTPLIVFDGGFEYRKLKTIYTRLTDRIRNAKKLNSTTEGRVIVFPIFIRQLFLQVVTKLQIKCVRCDFEADNEMACIARTLNCPVLSYDSDFYVSDILYIPFSSVEIRIASAKKLKYIPCNIYRVDAFLKSFGGLDRSLLPLIGVLLGNDYVEAGLFRGFYRHIKLVKRKFVESRQQRRIHAVIKWLQNETYESAVQKILGRSKMKYRKYLADQIIIAQEGYFVGGSKMLKYLDVDVESNNSNRIDSINPIYSKKSLELLLEDGEELSEREFSDSNDSRSEETNSDDEFNSNKEYNTDKKYNTNQEYNCNKDSSDKDVSDTEESIEDINLNINNHENELYNNLPNWFIEKFRQCEYPAVFMDLILKNRYFATPQLENYQTIHADHMSYDIVSAIYTILTSGQAETLIYVARSERSGIKNYKIPKSLKKLPVLEDLKCMPKKKGKEVLLDILGLDPNLSFLDTFPASWHLYLLAIEFWVKKATPTITKAHLYTVILCLLILNVVDNKIGVHRSVKNFFTFYNKKISCAKSGSEGQQEGNTIDQKGEANKDNNVKDNIINLISNISENDCLLCMKQLIFNFHMDEKLIKNHKLFDIYIVDAFAQLQNCLFHILFLNMLLNKPFEEFLISDCYNGTFLYNICNNFSKRTDLNSYVNILLSPSPGVSKTFNAITGAIVMRIGLENVGTSSNGKKRRRKKKNNKSENSELNIQNDEDVGSDEDEAVLDINNRFSLLQFKT